MSQSLDEFIRTLPAVDAHEHFRLEEVRLGKKVDAIWLFHQYACSDLLSAGMSAEDLKAVMDTEGPLDARWKTFKPFFERIRCTGYSMAVLRALKDLYGVNDLNDRTYRAASEKVQAANKPGMIERFIHKAGRITHVLNCNYQIEQPTPRCHSIMGLHILLRPDRGQVEKVRKESGVPVKDIGSYLAAAERLIARWAGQRVVALKMVGFPWTPVSRRKAEELFKRSSRGATLSQPEWFALHTYLLPELLKSVPRHNFTVAVHCGYYSGVDCDFTPSHVRNMVPILLAHPEIRFDLFHLSYPWIDEAIAVGKAFTNVSLNLAWDAIVNPAATQYAMSQMVSTVPANKILAMGGDYWELPDVAYGHLCIAREVLSRALNGCVAERRLSPDDARRIARLWLSENAFTIYPRMPRR